MQFQFQTEQDEDVAVAEAVDLQKKLVVHNDDVNTFDWVIETLIEVCKHTMEQAEQCAYIIHYRGKYAVKTGAFRKLKTMKDAITDRGINCTIE